MEYAAPHTWDTSTKKVSGYLWLLGLDKKPFLADYPESPDPLKTNFQMADVVTHENGKLTVKLLPIKTPKTERGEVMVVSSVTLEIRLDVHGDAYQRKGGKAPVAFGNKGNDASLIVPTTKTGKKWVVARMEEGDWGDPAESFRLNKQT